MVGKWHSATLLPCVYEDYKCTEWSMPACSPVYFISKPPLAQTICPVHHAASGVHSMPTMPAISEV